MTFARRVFWIAGIYGLVVLLPQYFLEGRIGHDEPPPITHPEFFYGFLGLATAWQIAFLLMASDLARYRVLIIPSILEKFSFAAAAVVLFLLGRVSATVLGFGTIDFVCGLFFVEAYRQTKPTAIQ